MGTETHRVKLNLLENVYPSLLEMSHSETRYSIGFSDGFRKALTVPQPVNNGCEGSCHVTQPRWMPEPFIIVLKAIMGPCEECLIISVLFPCMPQKSIEPM